VASHDRHLLQDFRRFFVASEAGCRAYPGTLDELDEALDRDHPAGQARYARGLHRLEAEEAHVAHVARRKARKKRYGRCSELDRGTPRVRLNQKRDQAQVSHGKLARQRSAQIEAARAWTKALRRTLQVELPLDVAALTLPADSGAAILEAKGLSATADGRPLFSDIDLRMGRERVAVVGANGAGKTTLLEILRGQREPSTGHVWRDLRRTGSIAQGAADWVLEESLLEHLAVHGEAQSLDAVATTLLAHRFPLALSQRPLRSLSPGERVRAALIALFHRAPRVELLLLDEPTEGLDLVGQRALTRALCTFQGGLVVATHDRALVAALAPSRVLTLGARARAEPRRECSGVRQGE
jgi:ATPase subunit of ABC transporter with duplicated ATPase domains